MRVLYDSDIESTLTYHGAIDVLERLMKSKIFQNVVHPPKSYFPTQKGMMTFTMGELIDEKVAGFRFSGSPKSTQLTLAMDTHTGEFKGMIVGDLIGVVRTACINAVAIKHLARKDAHVLGVIGSGFQAKHHALAALEVRDIKRIVVYSRSEENRQEFVRFLKERTAGKGIEIEALKAVASVVGESDILITASNSRTPLFNSKMLKKGLHINNVGPKYKGCAELPLAVYGQADILTTDSITQLYDWKGPGPVCFEGIIPRNKVLGLENYMVDFERDPDSLTLFCSMGITGSALALANCVLESMNMSVLG